LLAESWIVQFRRLAPGEDGPLMGNRVSGDWLDPIHIEGFSRDCFAQYDDRIGGQSGGIG
jgi:hypothetical protein